MQTVNFTRRYTVALLIIAILSIFAYLTLNKILIDQSKDAKLINISTEQKIIAYKIAFFTIYYKIDRLNANIKLMEKAHKQLISRDMPKELSEIYFGQEIGLNRQVEEYLFHAKKFYEDKDGQSQNYVLKNYDKLIEGLDDAVAVYLKEAYANTYKLRVVKLLILIMTLAALVFEVIFIFMPINRSINRKTKELVSEKDYSDSVIESSASAIITLDQQLKIRTFNKKAESVFGYSREEMLNSSSFKHIIPIELDEEESTREIEATNKKGQKFPIKISFKNIKENKELATIINIEDISKEKLNDKILQQQAKFAALGEMIAVIAHQWRQPLAELGFNCMYIKKLIDNPVLEKEVEKNQDIIHFMSETITNFENFYKKTESSQFNPAKSINQAILIVDSILSLNQIQVRRKISSEIEIFGNLNSLAHVVLSIIQNTIDAIKSTKPKKPSIDISLKETRKYIVLSIKDNAGGIKIAPIEEVFKPFIGNKKTSSTGIGLYMSQLVIQNQFNGSIEVQNIDGGAEFTIKLPY